MMRTMRPTDDEGERDVDQRQQRDLGPARAAAAGGCGLTRCAPGHHQAERALVGARRRQLAHDAAAEHHQDAVGQRQDLVELDRDHQDRAARVAALQQLAMDELDGADIDAARRLADQQHLGLRVPSRAPAPASAGCRRRSSRSAGRVRAAARRSAPSARRNGRRRAGPSSRQCRQKCGSLLVAQDGGFRRPGTPPPCPGAGGPPAHGRRRGRASRPDRVGWPASITRPQTASRPPVGARMPARTSSSSVWPLPETPAMPTISPARTLRADIVEQAHAAPVDQAEMLGLEQHLPGCGRRLVERQPHLAADHQLGQLLRDWSRRSAGRPRSAPWRMTYDPVGRPP